MNIEAKFIEVDDSNCSSSKSFLTVMVPITSLDTVGPLR